jgi:hypothetical protein
LPCRARRSDLLLMFKQRIAHLPVSYNGSRQLIMHALSATSRFELQSCVQ